MKKLLPLLISIATLVSCEKNQNNPDNNIITDSIQSTTFLVSRVNAQSASVTPAPQGPYHFLGYGYDITGEYANPNSARNQVVDIEKLLVIAPGRVILLSNPSSGFPEVIAAPDAELFSEKLSNKLTATEGLKVFGASLTSMFADSSLSRKYIYASATHRIDWQIAKFNLPYDSVENILSSSFKSDAENLSPHELVARYGTHVLSNINLGAKMEVVYQAETNNGDKNTAALKGITYGMAKIFGLPTGFYVGDHSYPAGNSAQKLHYKVWGGDTTKIPKLAAAGVVNPRIDINDWHQSSTLSNATIIGIGENGLLPVYNLIKDPAKKVAVKSYIDQYLLENRVRLIN